MMTLSKQRKFTFNRLLEDIRGSQCCVIKVRQYTILKVVTYVTYCHTNNEMIVYTRNDVEYILSSFKFQ